MTIRTARGKWLRVNKAHPCLICGKPDWCMVSPDGKKAICARTENNNRTGHAGWLYNLETGAAPIIKPAPFVKPSLKASLEIINKTYNQLLNTLTLSTIHRDNLLKRGLSESQIKALNYKSMPYDWDLIIRDLLESQFTLQGIPGFWTDNLGKWHLGGPHGIAIAIRDIAGRICGIQIRCDDTSNGKYKWLSSADRLNGCSSGTVVHVARPEGYLSDEVWITEVPLKADIASLKLKRIVLAIPGVACWSKAIPILWQLKSKNVVVAMDMDKLTNQAVNIYRIQLINRLLEVRFTVYEANWNSEFKGIDDILTAGEINA